MSLQKIINNAESCTFNSQKKGGPEVLIIEKDSARRYKNLTNEDFLFLNKLHSLVFPDKFFRYFKSGNVHVWFDAMLDIKN